MFRKTILAGLSLAFALSAAAAARADDTQWEQMEWNNQTIYAAPWTSSTRLDFDDDAIGRWYRIYFDGWASNYGAGNASTPLPGLHATVMYRLTEVESYSLDASWAMPAIDGKLWTFEYIVENASNNDGDNLVTQSRVSAIGFNVDPNVAPLLGGWANPGSEFDTLSQYGGPREICISDNERCQPGNDGPTMDDRVADGSFTLNYAWLASGPDITEIAFTDAYLKYSDVRFEQANGVSSFTGGGRGGHHSKHYCGCGHRSCTPPTPTAEGIPVAWVPEPGTWALMIVGFGAAGAALRRRRAIAA